VLDKGGEKEIRREEIREEKEKGEDQGNKSFATYRRG